MTRPRFTDEQVRRYSRHILLPAIGGHGQARLLAATVAVDVGTLPGRLAVLLLAAAGVGTVELCGPVDRPVADGEQAFPLAAGDRGRPVGDALAAALRVRNPDITVAVTAHPTAAPLALADATTLADALATAGQAVGERVLALATGARP